jgi:hypothetical protein
MLKIINLLAFLLMILVNYLANALPLNGKTTGQLSEQYTNLFVPAGITFSIWGIIYLLLLGFIMLQFREQNRQLIESIGWLFAISCLLNASWIVAWHYEQLPLSLLIMLGLLVTLALINRSIQAMPGALSHIAFGIYLGWICIATIANVTALLVSYQWGGWGISHEIWAMIMIGTGTIITALALVRLENPWVGLAVIWAFIGIVIKRQSDFSSIMMAAIIGMLLMGIVTAVMFYRKLNLS